MASIGGPLEGGLEDRWEKKEFQLSALKDHLGLLGEVGRGISEGKLNMIGRWSIPCGPMVMVGRKRGPLPRHRLWAEALTILWSMSEE